MIKDKMRRRVSDLLASGESFFLLRMPGKTPKLIIEPDGDLRVDLVGWRNSLDDAIRVGSPESRELTAPDMPGETSKVKYMGRVGYLIEKLKERGKAKTVISRVITGDSPRADWVEIAERLWNEFPDAVGYMFHTPATGSWIGATPEKILTGWYPAHFTTVALAGTIPADAPWNVKVYEEQQMVETFIDGIVRPLSSNLLVSKPKDCVYGPIKHIMTSFSGDLDSPARIKTLIDTLSPTPALSGLPREDAFADIEDLEDHDRQLYGGYFMIKEGKSHEADWTTFNAYVIIRCARFDAATGHWAIYSGGGVTNMSNASDEWDETTDKASRMLAILEDYKDA